jgi:hypothetical protein
MKELDDASKVSVEDAEKMLAEVETKKAAKEAKKANNNR